MWYISIFTATVYNIAIARSNPELIASAVIVLFITNLDEQVCDIVLAVSSDMNILAGIANFFHDLFLLMIRFMHCWRLLVLDGWTD